MKHFLKNRLTALAKEYFPSVPFHGKGMVASGWDYTAILFGDEHVVRFPKHGDAKKRAAVDVCLLAALQGRTPARLQVPLAAHAASGTALYVPVMGRPMTAIRFRKLGEGGRLDFTKKVAAFITALHAVPVSLAKKCGVQPESIRSRVARVNGYLSVCDKAPLESVVRGALTAFRARRKSVTRTVASTLVHGDLSDEHLYVGKSSKDPLGVIDFSDLSIDDPAREFSSLFCYGEQFVSRVFSRYDGAVDKDFLERAKLYRIEEAVKILSLALKDKSSMTLREAKDFLVERTKK